MIGDEPENTIKDRRRPRLLCRGVKVRLSRVMRSLGWSTYEHGVPRQGARLRTRGPGPSGDHPASKRVLGMYARSAARLRSERTHGPKTRRTLTTSHYKLRNRSTARHFMCFEYPRVWA